MLDCFCYFPYYLVIRCIASAMKIPNPIAANPKFIPKRLRSSLINGFGNHEAKIKIQPIINAILIILNFNLFKYNIFNLVSQTNPTNIQNTFPSSNKTTSSPFVLTGLIFLNLPLFDLYSTNNQCSNYLVYVQVFEYITLML